MKAFLRFIFNSLRKNKTITMGAQKTIVVNYEVRF